ncbi:MAG: membrane protein insertase YidC [Deltaproteobacteria bacterium]|nr:membrane protein insertase YidC [Deltaproteobacteria bacterium]
MKTSKDQQSSLFFFAIFVVVLLFTYKVTVWDAYFKPTAPPPPPKVTATSAPSETAAVPVVPSQSPGAQPNAVQPVVTTAPATGAPSEEEISSRVLEITTSDLNATVSLLGGRITRWELRHFAEKVEKGSPSLNLVEHVAGAPYPLGIYSGEVDDSRVQYRLFEPATDVPLILAGDDRGRVVLQGQLPDGRTAEKTITFYGSGYFVDVAVRLSAPPANAAPLALEWVKLVTPGSESFLDTHGNSGVVWFDGTRANRRGFDKVAAGEESLGNNRWIALSDKYFSVTMIATALVPTEAYHLGAVYASRMMGDSIAGSFRVFGGPNSYTMLRNAGDSLELIINFGYLAFLCAPLLSLLHMFFQYTGNYGLAIAALTILVKFAVLPLTAASFRSMKAMQDIQPEVVRLRNEVKDKQLQQQKLMELYKDKGVNPLGGCFPILIQLPIFLGLYTALSLAIELRHAPFALWIHDLSAPEKLPLLGIGIPVMVLLLVVSMLMQQWMTPSTMDPMQKKVMLVMPLVFGLMFMNFPAGLTLYWLVSNIISIGQTHALRRSGDKGGKRNGYVLTALVSAATYIFLHVLTLF